MKEEELIEKLKKVKLPQIELESHRQQLRAALLNSDTFKKKQEVRFMEVARTGSQGFWNRLLNSLNSRHPAWKVALASVFAVLIVIATLLSIPQTSNILKSSFFPEGRREISGPQLTAEEQKKATDILMADPNIQGILSTGAVIDKILPIQVTIQRINSATGMTEEVHETWAQAWLVKGSKDWGVQIDLVRGTIVSISP